MPYITRYGTWQNGPGQAGNGLIEMNPAGAPRKNDYTLYDLLSRQGAELL